MEDGAQRHLEPRPSKPLSRVMFRAPPQIKAPKPEHLDLFGSPEMLGQGGIYDADRCIDHVVPTLCSRHHQQSPDEGSSLVSTQDNFSPFTGDKRTSAISDHKSATKTARTGKHSSRTKQFELDVQEDLFDFLGRQPIVATATDEAIATSTLVETEGTMEVFQSLDTSPQISSPNSNTELPNSVPSPILPRDFEAAKIGCDMGKQPKRVSKRVLARQAADIVVCDIPPETFAEAIALLVESGTVDSERLKSFRRDVNWIQSRLPNARDGSPAAPLPCNPLFLRPILQTIIPGKYNISKKRWTNIRNELSAIQRKTGWLKPRQAEASLNTAAWKYGLSCVTAEQHIAMFRRFGIFCEAKNVSPSLVTHEVLETYLNHLKKSESRANPESSIRAIRYAWNKLLKNHPNWGGNPLPKKRNPNQIQDDRLNIPEIFYADLDAYCDKLRNPGRYNRLIPRKVAEQTIKARRNTYKLSAAVLVQKGVDPSQITSLRAISTAPAIETILNAYDDRNCHGEDWTYGAETTAFALKAVAKQWANLLPAELAAAIEICDTVRAPINTFPKKSAERLRQFDDKAVERRFWQLPKRLWDLAAELDKKGKRLRAAELARVALALAIAFDKPLRISNLAHLDLALDFERDRHGAIVGIRIEGERTTKKAPIIEGALSLSTQNTLKKFVEKYRPRLMKVDTTALFPGQKGKYLCAENFGKFITKKIKDNIGITVNPHLIRSLVATVILDEDPRDVALAQRMLDHKTSKTVIKSYGLQRGRAVSGDYQKTLQRRIRRLNK